MVKKFSLKKHVYITINNCDGFTKADTSTHGSRGVGREEFAIRWNRGDKKENQGETTFKPVKKAMLETSWDEKFLIKQCTFFYNAESEDPNASRNYLEKLIEFTLLRRIAAVEGETEEEAKKRRAKGIVESAYGKFNLAALFAGNINGTQTKMIEMHSFQSKKIEHILSVEIKVIDPKDDVEEKPKDKGGKGKEEEVKGTPSKKKKDEEKEEEAKVTPSKKKEEMKEKRLSKKVDISVTEETKTPSKKKDKKKEVEEEEEVIVEATPTKTPKKKDKKKESEEGIESTPLKTPKSKKRSSAIEVIECPMTPPNVTVTEEAEVTPSKKKDKKKKDKGSRDDATDDEDDKTAALQREIERLKRLNNTLQQENDSLRSSPTPTPTKRNSVLLPVAPEREEGRRPRKRSVQLEGGRNSMPPETTTTTTSTSNSGGEFKKYQREIKSLHEENSRYSFEFEVMRRIFETASELTFMTQDTPLAAVKINEALDSVHAYEHAGEPECYRGILDTLPMAYNVKSDGYVYAFYWVQTIYSVLKTAAHKLDRPILRTPADEAAFRIEPAFAEAEGDSGGGEDDLIAALQRHLYDAYVVALSRVYVILDAVAVKGILECGKGENNGGGTRSVLAAVNGVVKGVREAHLSSAIVRQTMEQALWCISGTLFNELVSKAEYCTCGMALHIKEALSELERFVSRDREVAPAKKRLVLIKDTANLLMMDKKLLSDDEVFATAIPSLNMSQVLKVLDNFTPDSYMEAKVDSSIMQLTRSRVNTRGSQQIKVDPHAFVQSLPK